MSFLIQGHRGWRAAWPENTLAGFQAAIEAGVDAIELDVGLTRDGVVVVCHDPLLDPDLTRGPDGAWISAPGPALQALSLAELRRFDVGRARPGGTTSRRFPDQRAVDGQSVPTLAEVLALAARHDVVVDVEIKTDPTRPGVAPAPEVMVDAVLEVARQAGERPRLALRAFEWAALTHAGSRAPSVPRTWLSERTSQSAAALWRGTADDVPEALAGLARPGEVWAPSQDDMAPAEAVERARALGLAVIPWTVNDAPAMWAWRRARAAGVCTDFVDLARSVARAAGR